MAGVAPTPELATYLDGQTVKAADLNGIATHLTGLFTRSLAGFRDRKPLLVARKGNSTAGSGIDYVLTWDYTSADTDGMWDGGQHFTVHTAGWYRLTLLVHWDAAGLGAGIRAAKILLNGANPNVNALASDNRVPSGAEGTVCFCQRLVRLPYQSSLGANAFQDSGGNVGLIAAFGGSTFTAEWVAPY